MALKYRYMTQNMGPPRYLASVCDRLYAPMGEVTAAAQAAGSPHALSGLIVHYQAALSATMAVACFNSLVVCGRCVLLSSAGFGC